MLTERACAAPMKMMVELIRRGTPLDQREIDQCGAGKAAITSERKTHPVGIVGGISDRIRRN